MPEGEKSFCMCREDIWMRMWWRHWLATRKDSSSTYSYMKKDVEQKLLPGHPFLSFFMLHILSIKSQASILAWLCKKEKIWLLGNKSWVPGTVSLLSVRCITASSELPEEAGQFKQTLTQNLQTCHWTIQLYQQHWVWCSLFTYSFFLNTY